MFIQVCNHRVWRLYYLIKLTSLGQPLQDRKAIAPLMDVSAELRAAARDTLKALEGIKSKDIDLQQAAAVLAKTSCLLRIFAFTMST
jgi:hypothetical protein